MYCGLKFNFPTASNPTIDHLVPQDPGSVGGPLTSFTEAQVADCIGHRGWCVNGVCIDHPGDHTDCDCSTWTITGPVLICP
jgi:hypothetical protein